jgi:hypothetical protein
VTDDILTDDSDQRQRHGARGVKGMHELGLRRLPEREIIHAMNARRIVR